MFSEKYKNGVLKTDLQEGVGLGPMFLHSIRYLHIYLLFVFNIMKTYLYNFDPLKPHFYIVKLGFTGVFIIFLISAQNIDCG